MLSVSSETLSRKPFNVDYSCHLGTAYRPFIASLRLQATSTDGKQSERQLVSVEPILTSPRHLQVPVRQDPLPGTPVKGKPVGSVSNTDDEHRG